MHSKHKNHFSLRIFARDFHSRKLKSIDRSKGQEKAVVGKKKEVQLEGERIKTI